MYCKSDFSSRGGSNVPSGPCGTQDRYALRFLWWPNGHLFGATSSPSVANFCLRKMAELHQEEFDSVAVETVKCNILEYVASVGSGYQHQKGAKVLLTTKVGLDLPMSEQVRQRQVTLNEGKTLVNTKGVYGSKFGNETHFLSFVAIVATRNGTEGSNFPV